ncbi:MAG: hypothetical protein KGH57_02210 [Candidatus Micrarchaeota archaeon]|nr:hypothetical protein [Candidatus Micrarchaeota archaeon]
MQPEQIQQAIGAADPDGTYRKLIESHTLECTGFIGGREKGIREELLDQGYKAVYQIVEFPCKLNESTGVLTLHLPDFIILGKTDKNTGKVYTVNAKDGVRLPLWNPHGSIRDAEARKYSGFYSRFGSTFEITFFVNNSASFQNRLEKQNAKIADRVVTALDGLDSDNLSKVKEITRRELDRLVLKEDGHGSVAELALIECLKDARRQKEEYARMHVRKRKEVIMAKAMV